METGKMITKDKNNANRFGAQTVMWTNQKIEDIIAEAGIYTDAANVNPNAVKTKIEVQNPYAKPGETFTEWAYAEYLWTHFYPIGNGRMAGMVAGGIDKEVIQLNEDTCWDGSPYGELTDENGKVVTTLEGTRDAHTLTVKNPTSGSVKNGWKYYRGADKEGNPAPIGAENAVVGTESFRAAYPEFADKSISNQALHINNAKEQEAVQERWSMEAMVTENVLGSPKRQRAYKSFVEIYLDFGHKYEKAENYTKSLDMQTGIVTVEYDYRGSHFKREAFASYPDQAVVTHVESDTELDFTVQLHTYHSEMPGYYSYEKVSDREVKIAACITNGSKDNAEVATVNAIRFEARMLLDGEGSFCVSEDNTTIIVKGGRKASFYVVGATNYVDYLHLDNSKPARDCERYSNHLKGKTYEEIKARHIADFSEEFNRTSLTLANAKGADFGNMPTEKRVRMDIDGKSGFLAGASSSLKDAHQNGVYTSYSKGDNELAVLEFNYGKYLILSGSRAGREAAGEGELTIPGSQPLNLTGKWNAAFSASWSGKYTININTEMNYWAAQPLNIGACERPLIDTFAQLAASGSITAANQYAVYNDRGDDIYQPGDPWVMHHNFDLWRGTQPIDNATAGLWPTGGAWLLEHAWQYYQFNRDKEYLAEVYPYMVGAAKFFTQFLVTDPKTGYLITAASCSPEQGGVQPGAAMDTQLIRNLYDMVRQASVILDKTEENATLLASIDEQLPTTYLGDEKGKLAPNLIGENGIIKEWVRGDVTFDFGKSPDGQWTVVNPFTGETQNVFDHAAGNATFHRHCSHLWEIYPGTHLSAYSEDEKERAIYKAFQDSVAAKGAGTGQGWGLAWRISLNARALNGNAASAMLEQLLTTRTSPNLFDQHPNFQIDGNYGATAGVIEMLVQSHGGEIAILPALPDRWQSGKVTGINTREDATVDISWEKGMPAEVKIYTRASKTMKVRSRYMGTTVVYDEKRNKIASTINEAGNLLVFEAEAGKVYTLAGFWEKPKKLNEGVYIGEMKYTTISQAVRAIEKNPPKSEAERVYIDITPGLYREQIVVNAPYITMRKKPGTNGTVLLSWYYGLGCLYDSCNESGYYDASVIGNGEAYRVKDWGATLKIGKDADCFEAEHITIENSYNRYYTQEELADIKGVDPDIRNSNFHRLEWIREQLAKGKSDAEINEFLQGRINITYKGVDASARERCAALHTSADRLKFTDCEIISTQDTVGINKGRVYFKDCKIGGTTDYICGSATAVFDECELFTNAGKGGDSATITAPSNPWESDGYLFYHCHITGTVNAGMGNFGRPWSGVNACATYIHTVIDNVKGEKEKLLIGGKGWSSMGGVEPENARFHEYGSITTEGKIIDTSDRMQCALLNEWSMLRYNPLTFTKGMDNWDPAGLANAYAGIEALLERAELAADDILDGGAELPTAPDGYEFYWESENEFVTITEGGKKMFAAVDKEGLKDVVIRLYVRDSKNKNIGGEKLMKFG